MPRERHDDTDDVDRYANKAPSSSAMSANGDSSTSRMMLPTSLAVVMMNHLYTFTRIKASKPMSLAGTLSTYNVLQLPLCLGQIKPVHGLGETQVGVDTGNDNAGIYRSADRRCRVRGRLADRDPGGS